MSFYQKWVSLYPKAKERLIVQANVPALQQYRSHPPVAENFFGVRAGVKGIYFWGPEGPRMECWQVPPRGRWSHCRCNLLTVCLAGQ